MCIPKEAPPLPKIGNTRENLIASLDGELYEVRPCIQLFLMHEYKVEKIYPEFAAKAREEGFEKIADQLEAQVSAEKYHAAQFRFNTLVTSNKY